MSASFSGNTQEEIDSKKRKMLDATDKHKAQITSHLKSIPKTPKSPSALKKSTYTINATQEESEENTSKMKIDWLIDIKELETTGVDDKSIAMDDVSIGSFGS